MENLKVKLSVAHVKSKAGTATYHGMLQDALKDLNVPPPNAPSNMVSLINSMMNSKAQIYFFDINYFPYL